MRPLALTDIARWCEARLVGADATIEAVDTDSRAIRPGALFVALRGQRHDGHAHAAAAVAAGARALLVERELDLDAPQLVVADSERALGLIAAGAARGRATTVLALTGSNGKTSVKTLLHAILSRVAPTHVSPGNRNNQIGLPLAVLEQPEDARYAVYEMGAGQPGDIAWLASIAQPHVALVNNIGPAHIERMGSLLGIAATKGAIYQALPADGIAVVNADDAFGRWFAEAAAPRRVLRFGLESSAEVSATGIESGAEGSRFRLHAPVGDVDVALPLPGRHNIANALAAASMALAVDAPLATIAEGLAAAEAVAGRQRRHRLASGALLIDDSYNANPASVAAAIASLAALPGEGWLVLGDMAELGPGAESLHAEVGERARAAGVARLFTVGPLSAAASRAFGAGAQHCASQDELVAVLRTGLCSGVACLVKGSRSSAMDRVVAALLGAAASGEGADAA